MPKKQKTKTKNKRFKDKHPHERIRSYIVISIIIALLISSFGLFWLTIKTGRDSKIKTREKRSTLIELSVEDLKPLVTGFYELWVEAKAKQISLGYFKVDPEGNLFDISGGEISTFELDGNIDKDEITSIYVTIESEDLLDGIPSSTKILELGDNNVIDNDLDLRFKYPDSTNIEAAYILSTPFDNNLENESSGIWFFDKATNTSSLKLPIAPPGWTYEAWLIYEDSVPFSMGRFINPSSADDSTKYFKDTKNIYFPGESFIKGLPEELKAPLDLRLGRSLIYITLEPNDNGIDQSGELLFNLVLFESKVKTDTKTNSVILMKESEQNFPKGMIRITDR